MLRFTILLYSCCMRLLTLDITRNFVHSIDKAVGRPAIVSNVLQPHHARISISLLDFSMMQKHAEIWCGKEQTINKKKNMLQNEDCESWRGNGTINWNSTHCIMGTTKMFVHLEVKELALTCQYLHFPPGLGALAWSKRPLIISMCGWAEPPNGAVHVAEIETTLLTGKKRFAPLSRLKTLQLHAAICAFQVPTETHNVGKSGSIEKWKHREKHLCGYQV